MAGTHRKPRRTLRAIAKATMLATATGAVALSVAVPIGLAQHATAPAEITTVAYVTVTPAQRACAAFTTWERHPTAAHLHSLVTDSFTVPARWLGVDVAQVYLDVESHNGKYLSDDEAAVAQDCDGGYGL